MRTLAVFFLATFIAACGVDGEPDRPSQADFEAASINW